LYVELLTLELLTLVLLFRRVAIFASIALTTVLAE
jgi:hypothetical protein